MIFGSQIEITKDEMEYIYADIKDLIKDNIGQKLGQEIINKYPDLKKTEKRYDTINFEKKVWAEDYHMFVTKINNVKNMLYHFNMKEKDIKIIIDILIDRNE